MLIFFSNHIFNVQSEDCISFMFHQYLRANQYPNMAVSYSFRRLMQLYYSIYSIISYNTECTRNNQQSAQRQIALHSTVQFKKLCQYGSIATRAHGNQANCSLYITVSIWYQGMLYRHILKWMYSLR